MPEKFSKGDEVWARLGASADFAAGRVAELTVDGVVVEVTATSEKHSLAKENVFRANPGAGDVSDLTALLALNEATMLDALRQRYSSSSIYTFAAEMLTCLNPYAPLPALYTEEARQRAQHPGSELPEYVRRAIYGEMTLDEKRAALDQSTNNWWKEYAARKNDEEEEHVADTLLYDERCHLPRTAPRQKIASSHAKRLSNCMQANHEKQIKTRL